MSQPHFVRNLLELNSKCPNDHMRHFDSVKNGQVKKIIYFNRSYLMIVTMKGSKQIGVRITVRAPSHSLIVEQGAIQRELGVTEKTHYASA